MKMVNLDGAEDIYSQHMQSFPHDIFPHVKLARINACFRGKILTDLEWSKLNNMAKTSTWKNYSVDVELDSMVVDIYEDRCPEMDVIELAKFILTLTYNPGFFRSAGLYHEYVATLSLKLGDLNAALLNIREAVKLSPQPNRQIYKIELELAMRRLDETELSIHAFEEYLINHPRRFLAYRDMLNTLKMKLRVLKADES